jgi:hypothetical protein
MLNITQLALVLGLCPCRCRRGRQYYDQHNNDQGGESGTRASAAAARGGGAAWRVRWAELWEELMAKVLEALQGRITYDSIRGSGWSRAAAFR